ALDNAFLCVIYCAEKSRTGENLTRMGTKLAKRRGRPALPAGEGKRVPLNMRTTQDLRDKIDATAKESGRSLAKELEYRLERSSAEEQAIAVVVKEFHRQLDEMKKLYEKGIALRDVHIEVLRKQHETDQLFLQNFMEGLKKAAPPLSAPL